MKTSKISLIGIIFGIMFTADSIYRYYYAFPDFDRLIAYTSIGILIMCVSWLYNENLQNKRELTTIGDYLEDKK